MEYKLETDTAWKALSGTSLNLQASAKADQAVKVYVRMKATSTAAASLPVEFTIPQLIDAPTGTIDYTNETITGLANGNYQYSTNGTSWTALSVTDGTWNISALISTSARTLYLRTAATDLTPISSCTTFTIDARSAAPSTPAFVYNDFYYPNNVILAGVTSDMQYRKSTDTDWVDITEDNVLFDAVNTATTYYVRMKGDNHHWASSDKSINLVAKASAPSCVYDSETETITGLNSLMEISINGEPFESILSGTTYKLTYLIDEIPAGKSLEVNVRVKATSTAPASQTTDFIIYSRLAMPNALPTLLTNSSDQPELPNNPSDQPELPDNSSDQPELPNNPADQPELPDNSADQSELPDNSADQSELPDNSADQSELPDNSADQSELPENPTDQSELPDNPTDPTDLPDTVNQISE